ncbi:hypothetical protein [Streptomyces hawaiiensis]|uniref:hypothetical protein n=1 Tax=Streptomyces hawaiiensis TaxID=67305 RepID=UPI00365D2AD2
MLDILYDTSGIPQHGAEFRRCRVVELRDSYDMLPRTDGQGAEIHRTDDVVHHPGSAFLQDASGQLPAPAASSRPHAASTSIEPEQEEFPFPIQPDRPDL